MQRAHSQADRKARLGLFAALAAAVAASACCTIPLLLVALGVGGAWVGALTAFEPYRPIFIGVAVLAFVYVAYREWRASRAAGGIGCDCEEAVSPRMRRALLGAGAVAALALIASPWLIHAASPPAGVPAALVAAPVSTAQVVLDVEGMTCASCHVTVQQALLSVAGVEAAEVSFEPPRAVVRYDPARVTVAALTEATATAGYPSHPHRSTDA
jgi:mercuric ion transport protein